MGATHRHKKMRSITHCPVCQTQFFVSEEQLSQHRGQVRCGHCLSVFDAIVHSVPSLEREGNGEASLAESAINIPKAGATLISKTDITSTMVEREVGAHLASDSTLPSIIEITPAVEIPSNEVPAIDLNVIDTTVDIAALGTSPPDLDTIFSANATDEIQSISLEDDTQHLAENEQINYFDYLVQPPAASTTKNSPVILMFVLLLLAVMQSLYFLRNPIAIYYPHFKPYLQQVCHKFGCSIDLPKKIELITIDDSDMQEDADHAGLIKLSTSLINQSQLYLAYPNVQLTLTDVDDRPALRRLFEPNEYLPDDSKIGLGMAPGEEVRVKLAITVEGMPVAGYRIFVTY
jgi:predicted Zn finger-like uncharacterized protein